MLASPTPISWEGRLGVDTGSDLPPADETVAARRKQMVMHQARVATLAGGTVTFRDGGLEQRVWGSLEQFHKHQTRRPARAPCVTHLCPHAGARKDMICSR